MGYIDDYKSMLNSLTVNETVNLECTDGVIREFKSSTISGSTQLHNSDGVIANTSDNNFTYTLIESNDIV